METFILIIRLVLAGILAVAGIAKLADLAGSRQAMRDFGLPTSLATLFGLLLPIAEIAIALALLESTTAWAGAIGALVLLFLFIGGITINLVRGRTPNCHCFGQLHSEPIGRATLVRNVLLMLPAALIVARGPAHVGSSLFDWLTTLSPLGYVVLIGGVVAIVIIALQTWVVFNLLRQNGRLLLRLESIESHLGLPDPTIETAKTAIQPAEVKGLPIGTPAPTFELPNLAGAQQSIKGLLSPNQSLLLIFSSPTCGPCVDLVPEVAQWQRAHGDKLTIAIVTRGNIEEVRAKMGELNAANILLQKETEVATVYQITGTPSAVLIGPDGNIRSPIAAGPTAIRELIGHATQPRNMLAERLLRRAPIHLDTGVQALDSQPKPVAPTLGAAAPAFHLPDLDGKEVDLSKLRGAPTLLLFWNPTCGYCRRMLGDLQAWETNQPSNAPRLVLISTGTAEANRAQNLRSPVLLDTGFSTGHAYGAKGTPSAVLIDGHGKLASEVVVGATSILPMLNPAPKVASPLMVQPVAQPVAQPGAS